MVAYNYGYTCTVAETDIIARLQQQPKSTALSSRFLPWHQRLLTDNLQRGNSAQYTSAGVLEERNVVRLVTRQALTGGANYLSPVTVGTASPLISDPHHNY
ncbi:hypothetical protein CDAR_622441 [Caerostris darwini]|uniref:Uncharacterized protein n=1 Tax=Caerostris darwini TaxID=1538125 RepID=A0AAV4TCP1_9ARAC|nr:hypothetical protein CDAR_622441 [Caerostris darwini]